MSAATAAKAKRLVAEGRVTFLEPDLAIVKGDHDDYRVRFGPEGVVCNCAFGLTLRAATEYCSHVLAAAEVRRTRRQ